MISIQDGLNFFDIEGAILYFPDFIDYIVYYAFVPLKGNSPVNIAYSITPVDQTSILPSTLYPLFLTKH